MKLREKSRMQNCMHDIILSKKNTQESGKTPTCLVRSHIIYINCSYVHFLSEVYTFLRLKYIIIKPLKFFVKKIGIHYDQLMLIYVKY